MMKGRDVAEGRYRVDVFSQGGWVLGHERVDRLHDAHLLCTDCRSFA
jgi:hypothetical protein